MLAWLEASALGQAVRGAGVWSYATINLVHILGLATLFGSVLMLDLKLLGLFPRTPLPVLSGPTVRMAMIGFLVAAASGACLLSTNATEYAGNPFLLIKFAAIAVALGNIALLHRSPAWRLQSKGPPSPAQRRRLAIGGGISLMAWATALAAGRMLGYW
jgi:hypothetical protein